MRNVLVIGVSGGMGALSRYWLEGFIVRRYSGIFPLGTFLVNISGAFLLGLAFTVMTERFLMSPHLRSAVTIGFLGAYTTFSTLSLETLRLVEDGAYFFGLLNALGSLVIGLVAVWLGVVVGRTI